MEFKVITVPFDEDLGNFLEGKIALETEGAKIRNVKPELFTHNGKTYWTVFVAMEEGASSEKVTKPYDISENVELSGSDSVLYEKLREWRNEKASEMGMSAYMVMTNIELKRIASFKPADESELKRIKGIGDWKCSNFSDDILDLIKNHFDGMARC